VTTKLVVHLTYRQDPTGFWSARSPDLLPDGSKLVAGDWDFDEARKLARDAVPFSMDLDELPDYVEIVETLPDQREAL
jgi:hypothetical protein